MGHLPQVRVHTAKPFWSSGVDYAGAIWIRDQTGRGRRSYKAYICFFICMATKAVHLELVSDLSSTAFIKALRRFVAIRGRCARLYSDNGINFKGAERELRQMFRAASEFYEGCRSELDRRRIDWTFIPLSAPHFGGLWEAGIKSTKYHFRRVVGDQILTRDDMCTLLSEVGACLNSTPLYPTSNDPSDLNVITPGHFLVGESLVGLPEPGEDEGEQPRNHKQHLELIYSLRNSFWHR